jgi:NTP pyrophosphatase (non-canonical NTP hydrolase)
MELNHIIELQKEFDKNHKINFNWAEEISKDNLQHLQYLIIALAGEVGEMANCVKKVLRGDEQFESSKSNIEGELTDVFIYTIKIAYQMNIDLEKSYTKKLEINRSKFKPFEEQ